MLPTRWASGSPVVVGSVFRRFRRLRRRHEQAAVPFPAVWSRLPAAARAASGLRRILPAVSSPQAPASSAYPSQLPARRRQLTWRERQQCPPHHRIKLCRTVQGYVVQTRNSHRRAGASRAVSGSASGNSLACGTTERMTGLVLHGISQMTGLGLPVSARPRTPSTATSGYGERIVSGLSEPTDAPQGGCGQIVAYTPRKFPSADTKPA